MPFPRHSWNSIEVSSIGDEVSWSITLYACLNVTFLFNITKVLDNVQEKGQIFIYSVTTSGLKE